MKLKNWGLNNYFKKKYKSLFFSYVLV